jgi:hypothetical protein
MITVNKKAEMKVHSLPFKAVSSKCQDSRLAKGSKGYLGVLTYMLSHKCGNGVTIFAVNIRHCSFRMFL